MKPMQFTLFAPLALCALLAACGGNDSSSSPTPSASFDVTAAGSNSLMPADVSTAQDPTSAANSPSGSTPYFVPRSGINVSALQALMADATTFPRAEDAVTVTVGSDTYTGYRLADVVVRATKFRPADYNTGAFGATTAVIAVGAQGYASVFSFTELIRTDNGNKTIVAIAKNGQPLPDSEGTMAVVAANDSDTTLRKTVRLSAIQVRNEYVATSYSLPGATTAAFKPGDVDFQVKGAVVTATTVSAPVISTASTQGYYAVQMVGNRDASSFATYHFQEYGPRHMNFWYGQGIRLTDVIDTAVLNFPKEKNRCFVVVQNANNQHALFSCGELYNSKVGVGDALAGAASRSRSKGVLLVTDDFRGGTGNGVMMSCWSDLANCTKTNAADPTAYTSAMDANGDKFNDQSLALISTEDKLPFIPFGRWYPMPTTCASAVWKCNAWIDVGERLQQGIKSINVTYVGNAN